MEDVFAGLVKDYGMGNAHNLVISSWVLTRLSKMEFVLVCRITHLNQFGAYVNLIAWELLA